MAGRIKFRAYRSSHEENQLFVKAKDAGVLRKRKPNAATTKNINWKAIGYLEHSLCGRPLQRVRLLTYKNRVPLHRSSQYSYPTFIFSTIPSTQIHRPYPPVRVSSLRMSSVQPPTLTASAFYPAFLFNTSLNIYKDDYIHQPPLNTFSNLSNILFPNRVVAPLALAGTQRPLATLPSVPSHAYTGYTLAERILHVSTHFLSLKFTSMPFSKCPSSAAQHHTRTPPFQPYPFF